MMVEFGPNLNLGIRKYSNEHESNYRKLEASFGRFPLATCLNRGVNRNLQLEEGEDRAHAERFGIFIGLWVPSLLILSNRLSRLAEEQK